MKRGLKISAVILTVILALGTLAACTPSEESLKKKYTDEGYLAISLTLSTLGIDSEDVEYAFYASNLLKHVSAIRFKKSSKADEFYNANKDKGGDYTHMRRKGALVLWGTEDAVNLA